MGGMCGPSSAVTLHKVSLDQSVDSDLDSVLKFDPDGNVVESFGAGMFIWPHGLDIDAQGNVWVTDAVSDRNIPQGDDRGILLSNLAQLRSYADRMDNPEMASSFY